MNWRDLTSNENTNVVSIIPDRETQRHDKVISLSVYMERVSSMSHLGVKVGQERNKRCSNIKKRNHTHGTKCKKFLVWYKHTEGSV